MKHRVPTCKELGYREPDGINPDIQISCRRCGVFGMKDGEEGCDWWAESPAVQCLKTYGGVRCDRTAGHKPGCEEKRLAPDGEWIGSRCLCRPSYFHSPGAITPDPWP